nr:PREDICTED: uncharacterized protein LOC107397975 [Tribolium castaneum]|eukprot:XP_015835767.1 PREDICTED: uncharacterized protein LOC107397975 [Tribolium castaneum]
MPPRKEATRGIDDERDRRRALLPLRFSCFRWGSYLENYEPASRMQLPTPPTKMEAFNAKETEIKTKSNFSFQAHQCFNYILLLRNDPKNHFYVEKGPTECSLHIPRLNWAMQLPVELKIFGRLTKTQF